MQSKIGTNNMTVPNTLAAQPTLPKQPFETEPLIIDFNQKIKDLNYQNPTDNNTKITLNNSQKKEVEAYLSELMKNPEVKAAALKKDSFSEIQLGNITAYFFPKDDRGQSSILLSTGAVQDKGSLVLDNGVRFIFQNDNLTALTGRSIQDTGNKGSEGEPVFKNNPSVKSALSKLIPNVKLPTAFDLVLNQNPSK
jgi:hypothetical protein